MPTDRPEYDGAAYAIDRALRHAALREWRSVVRRANEAVDAVRTAPFPRLADRLRRQSADAAALTGRPDPDAERVEELLRGMEATVSEMHVLAVRGEAAPGDGLGGTGFELDDGLGYGDRPDDPRRD